MKVHAGFIALTLCAFSAATLSAQKSGTAGWKEYLGGPDGSHYSPLKQIDRKNVGKMEVAWSYETGDAGAYFFSPLVVDNIAYVAARQGAVCRQMPLIARNQQLAISESPSDEAALRRVTRVSSCLNSSSHSLSVSECSYAVEVIPPSKFWPSDSRSPCSNENGHGQD
jgi:hypothetical protein